MKTRGASRGVIFLDLVVGLAMTATLALVVAYMFRSASTSYQISTRESTILTNSRKALFGYGSARGVMTDIQYSTSVTTTSSNSLSVTDFTGVTTTYTVTSAGNLQSVKQGVATVKASGLSNFLVRYYGTSSIWQTYETNVSSTVTFVTVQYDMKKLTKTVSFYSGISLRNVQ